MVSSRLIQPLRDIEMHIDLEAAERILVLARERLSECMETGNYEDDQMGKDVRLMNRLIAEVKAAQQANINQLKGDYRDNLLR